MTIRFYFDMEFDSESVAISCGSNQLLIAWYIDESFTIKEASAGDTVPKKAYFETTGVITTASNGTMGAAHYDPSRKLHGYQGMEMP